MGASLLQRQTIALKNKFPMVRNKNNTTQSSSGNASSSNSSSKSPIKQNSNSGRTHRKSSSTCSVALIDDKPTTAASSNRRSLTQSSHYSPDTDYDDSNDAGVSTSGSVHKQNLYIVSFPIIFLFNVLRSLIYQLFCIFRYLYGASTRVIYRPNRRECNIEIVVGANQQQSQHKDSRALLAQPNNSIVAAYPLVGVPSGSLTDYHHNYQNKYNNKPQLEMSHKGNTSSGHMPTSPGPGDPLLAKQKHHHRRAFEYISKALKIDEENEG